MRISDWSSDVCSSDLANGLSRHRTAACTGMVTSVRSRIAKAIWDNGVRTAVDRHQGCRSHTTSGAYSSLANRTGLPSTSCAARRSFPPTSCHRKGATSRQRLGAPSATVRDEITSRSEEHTSELQSLMRISYAVFCLKNKYLKYHL